MGRPASGLRAAASCVHFHKLPVSLLSPCQDPAAASISDGDCDAREGESVAMNYKPSPLQVKLGEWVWGVREMRGMDQVLWAGSATWCHELNHLGPDGSKTQATKSLSLPGTLFLARQRGMLQCSAGPKTLGGVSEAKMAPVVPGERGRDKGVAVPFNPEPGCEAAFEVGSTCYV